MKSIGLYFTPIPILETAIRVFSARVSNMLVDQSLGLKQIAKEYIFILSVSTYNKVFQEKNRHRYESRKMFKTRFEVDALFTRVFASVPRGWHTYERCKASYLHV